MGPRSARGARDEPFVGGAAGGALGRNGPSRGLRLAATACVTFSLCYLGLVLSALHPWSVLPLSGDFPSFWTGGEMIRSGQAGRLFDMEAQRALQLRLRGEPPTSPLTHNPFHSPPALALLLAPLTLLPFPAAYFAWVLLNLAGFLAALRLPLRGHGDGWPVTFLLLGLPTVLASLLEGQMNGLVAAAVGLGIVALRAGRPALGGALLGLLWLKPQYALVLFLVLLVKRRWRELAGMAAVGAGLAGVSLLVVGISGAAIYLEVLRRIGAFYPPVESHIHPAAMANWRALLMNLFPGLPESTGGLLVMLLGGLTVGASLWVWRGAWDPRSVLFPRRMLVALMATVVAAPHSHYHGASLLLVPLALAMVEPVPGEGAGWRRAWIGLLTGGIVLAFVAFPLRSLSWLLVPYLLPCMALLTWSVLRAGRSRHREPEGVELEAGGVPPSLPA